MRIRDVMSTEVVVVSPSTSLAAARAKLLQHGIQHLVVVERHRVAGVLSDRDIPAGRDTDSVATVMTRRVATIASSATLRAAAGKLNGHDVGCLVVFDGDELAGIVTSTDLLRALAKGDTHPAPQPDRVVLRDRGPQKKHRRHGRAQGV